MIRAIPIEDFITNVYCCVDENWDVLTEGKKLRQQEYAPKLTDQEGGSNGDFRGELEHRHRSRSLGLFYHHWPERFP